MTALRALACSTARGATAPQFLVGTHHKVLTVYFLRIFSDFARITGRSMSSGSGDDLDYGADIVRDHHSYFDFDRARPDWVGLHVIRDPRDQLVSAAKYHTHSTEPWLHRPLERFGGMTYQEKIRSITDEEGRLLFELENASSDALRDFRDWNYNRPRMSELRYEELVSPTGDRVFAEAIDLWPVHATERDLLVGLFRHYSVYGRGLKGQEHIRNPSPQQWREHFTPAVQAAFDARFPGLVDRLGYT